MELFDREETFGDDYLYFYQEFLGGERNRADARPHRASPTGAYFGRDRSAPTIDDVRLVVFATR